VKSLEVLAQGLGAKASIYHQLEPLEPDMPYLCQKNRFQAQPLLATRLLELILI
jgi:hypothetical protein